MIFCILNKYTTENITITGHSFGGAWSALVIQRMNKYLKKNQKFESYINHKSFTNIGDVFVANYHQEYSLDSNVDAKKSYVNNNKSSFLGKTINLIASILYLQFDAEKALQNKELPVQKMKFYAGNDDYNVPSQSSMAVLVETKNSEKFNTPTEIKYYNNEKGDHSYVSKTLYSTKNFISGPA